VVDPESAAGRQAEIEFHPEAQAEMLAAARYYQRQRHGLGEDFLNEVEGAATFAARYPGTGTPLGDGYRWILTRRFRYAVIYRQIQGLIEVIAVAHLRRRPNYWRTRM